MTNPSFLHQLKDREGEDDLSIGCRGLLDRLRKGHPWLTNVYSTLMNQSDLGYGTRLEHDFLHALQVWDGLDFLIRFTYKYAHCCYGPGRICPETAPVTCRGCEGQKVGSPAKQQKLGMEVSNEHQR